MESSPENHGILVMADVADEEESLTIKVEEENDVALQSGKEIEEDDESTTTSCVADASKHLSSLNLEPNVAERLSEVYKSGKLCRSDLDDRALDALKEFPVEGAVAVLSQFLDSNLEHVSNKSAFLCGVMKTYRQKSRAMGPTGDVMSPSPSESPKGPDETKIKAILDRTGYTLDVTTGQRKFGGPPPGWEGAAPGNGCEVFCGKIPRDLYEDELIPLFEKCGKIWDLRLMMDPMTGLNRGYAFVTFTTREAAVEAVKQLNDHELRRTRRLGVTISFNNHRLFVGNIPKNRDRGELFAEFCKHAPNLKEVIIYSSPDDKKKNRGFCFLEYDSHKAASLAKRRLETGRVKVWSCDIIVDWADPQEEPDDTTMSKVKVLYVRNLTSNTTEEKLREVFEAYGKIERVKKIKDYAFIHFENREHSINAMNALNSKEVCGSNIEISLAKPPSDKKKKEEILRKRERRMMKAMGYNTPFPAFPPFHVPYGPLSATGIYGIRPGRGGNVVNPNGGVLRGGGGGGGFHRGFDHPGWNWGWTDGGGNWNHPQRNGNGHPWMANAEPWANGGGRSGGYPTTNGYLVNAGGGGANGNSVNGGSRFGRQQGQQQQQRTAAAYTR